MLQIPNNFEQCHVIFFILKIVSQNVCSYCGIIDLCRDMIFWNFLKKTFASYEHYEYDCFDGNHLIGHLFPVSFVKLTYELPTNESSTIFNSFAVTDIMFSIFICITDTCITGFTFFCLHFPIRNYFIMYSGEIQIKCVTVRLHMKAFVKLYRDLQELSCLCIVSRKVYQFFIYLS